MPWITKEMHDSLMNILAWGSIGGIFAFVRLLVTQEARSKGDFWASLFVGAVMGSLVGWSLEPYQAKLMGGVAPYVALTAILSEKIVLFVIKQGAEVLEDPKKVGKIVKKVLDKQVGKK